MRKKIPERNMEPPENYVQEPKFCKECKENDCLLDLNKECPEIEKADRIAHAEFLESKEDDNEEMFGEELDEHLTKQALHEEPSEEEKEFMRQNLIAFREE